MGSLERSDSPAIVDAAQLDCFTGAAVDQGVYRGRPYLYRIIHGSLSDVGMGLMSALQAGSIAFGMMAVRHSI